ncbi:hypothetical protein PR048_018336 [Dryococelus australis]|uniref:DDE Tnp4 domain-containing protein n=1 Tax=Dryococelus australis TaxID=614101 RepID=A0ABQ9HBY6_9NEOP|nr:hypothetical protein PR048_018336 [Dryococelus australis]
MALADASYKFAFIYVGAYGETNDGDAFERSSIERLLSKNKRDIHVVEDLTTTADSVPYVIVADEEFPSETRIFLKPIETQAGTADFIVLAACCLHNFLRQDINTISTFEEAARVSNEEINVFDRTGAVRGNHVREAAMVREKFTKFFISLQGTATCP